MRELRAAFPKTIPVLMGYLFLGITYGILMVTNGFPFWLPILTALVIYTGSMEFLLVGILLSPFNPFSVLATTLMVGARHIFYGLSMLTKYRGTGKAKFYLIYTTSDETFALNCDAGIPEGLSRSRYYFWVSFLDQMYWVIGCAIGGLAGSLLTLNTKGIDFVMNAMFLVIALNGIEKVPARIPALLGLGCSLLALALFGPNRFLIPAMILILIALMIYRPFEQRSRQ